MQRAGSLVSSEFFWKGPVDSKRAGLAVIMLYEKVSSQNV